MAYNNKDRRKVLSTDVVTLIQNIKYRYTKKRNTIRVELAQANITGAVEQPNLLVYEARLLDEIDQRQRFALVHEAGRLNKAALIVESENIGMLDDLMQTFG